MIERLNAAGCVGLEANCLKRLAATAALFIGAITAPTTGFTQALHIDNNTTVTAAPGTTTWSDVVAGFNSGTVGGVPGGTYVVPTGANVVLSNLFAGFAAGSSGLVQVNGGNITTTNPASQYYIGFNGQGTLVVSNGGTVFSASQSYVGYNAGSNGVLTVEGPGSSYTNAGFFIVGNGGSGQLNVLNGGSVSSTSGTLQIGGGSVGTALVSGAGSTLSAGTFLGVGVSPGSLGNLTITNGGAATSGSGTYLAFNAGSVGTLSVSNGGLLTSPLLVVGQSGTADLQIQSNGTVTISGKTIVGAIAGTSTVEVQGAGAALNVQGNDVVVGGQGNGAMTVSNQGTVTVTGGGTAIAGQCAGLPSFCATPVQGGSGTVTVTDPGSVLNADTFLSIGQFGAGTLTIANSGNVFANAVIIAQNAGSTGTLNIGAAAGNAPVAPGTLNAPTVTFGAGSGDIVFNHTDTSGSYSFAPAISGTGAVDVFSGNTVMTGLSDYFGPTTIYGGALSAGGTDVFSANSDYVVRTGGTLNLNGFNQTVASISNAGLINMGDGTPPDTLLTTTNYVGAGGTLRFNTYLGADNSPSDRLVINGGSATGTSFLRIRNAGGPGVETVANGILVVQAINGGTTAPGAFALAGEARGGALDYYLFRGGLNGSDPENWFLRSSFVNGPGPEEPIGPTPPPDPLPPGTWPIIGPELATYGVVQPLARQMGLTTLGTLHERIGNTFASAIAGHDREGWGSRIWGRVFGQQVNNRYEAFADPHADGFVLGFQSGADLWRGSLLPGHRDAAGFYAAYTNGNVDVTGLVTNPAATGYEHSKTGTVKLDAWSVGAYWTHYGPTDWYVDAVLQGTYYTGGATTTYASLTAIGTGFIASLEAGYPVPLPLFGPGFVLEPQAQIVWQHVAFDQSNDGLGVVALGSTSGASGRIGLRGQWTIIDADKHIWQPYVRANLWQDWGADAATAFDGMPVQLSERATRLDLAGGLTARITPSLSLYAQAGYQFAVADTDAVRRDGVKGDLGLRSTW